ncbi:hypothetical protein, partial [Bifidobacterium bifidum]|uniref:hypothetical protein n=1 Tax=Bifidobacterium bifidum TaxID=1681 RepID=UPI0021C490BC
MTRCSTTRSEGSHSGNPDIDAPLATIPYNRGGCGKIHSDFSPANDYLQAYKELAMADETATISDNTTEPT